MKTSSKNLLAMLVCTCLLTPVLANACALVSPEVAAENRRKAIIKAKEDATALRDQADLVFVGRLKRLDFHEETRDMGPGKMAQTLQVHKAVFDLVDDIKGKHTPGQVLSFTTNKNRIVIVGCGPRFDSLPRENGASERYLVYARDGVILRTNQFPWNRQMLDAHEEANVVRGTN